jgi:WD40 repeat protein
VIWDLAAEPPTARLLALFPSARADQWLHCGAFSPDGRLLATANPDGTIYLLQLNPPAAARDAGE